MTMANTVATAVPKSGFCFSTGYSPPGRLQRKPYRVKPAAGLFSAAVDSLLKSLNALRRVWVVDVPHLSAVTASHLVAILAGPTVWIHSHVGHLSLAYNTSV